METNATPELLTALNEFQSNLGNVIKDKQNAFIKNKYATLDAIIATIKPLLKQTGLSYVQLVNNEGVETIVFHKDGGCISTGSKFIQPQMNKGISAAQGEGIAITYTKRYQLSSILGISAEEDTDGQYNNNGELIRTPKNDPKLSFKKRQCIEDLKDCTTTAEVTEIWNSNKELQSDKEFSDAIKSKGSQLKAVEEKIKKESDFNKEISK